MRWLALAVLAGCGFTGQGWYDANVRDLDGDGSVGERFGGPDCRDDDPGITDCDADGDGFRSVVVGGEDCDDTDAAVSPEAVERCNLRDDDCDGLIDNDDPDAVGTTPLYTDRDGDGAGDPDDPQACQSYAIPGDPTSGRFVADPTDCDDDDPSIRPDADERCDGYDNNCDGVVDDVGLWFLDADGDGYGVTGTQATGSCDLVPGSGVAAVAGDCNDADSDVNPGRPEVPYDGIDANCNGGLDDWDVDFDGHVPDAHWPQAQAANLALPVDERWSIVAGDCDDADPARFVGNTEVCDGVDNDCDQAVDAADLASAGPTDELALRAQVVQVFADLDGDGFFGTSSSVCPAQVDPTIYALSGDDCFDSGTSTTWPGLDPASIHPDAPELCDGVDNDCDGRVDHVPGTTSDLDPYFLDTDGDGYGSTPVGACGVDDGAGIVAFGGDCNDASDTVFPGAPEVCGDAVRQDCSTASLYDCDGDGFEGDYVGGGTGEDCDDAAVEAYPGAALEVCDGVDNDCDGLVDSADTDNLDAADEPFWYQDQDGDGYGADGTGIQQCDRPAGYVLLAGDCDDQAGATSPESAWYRDVDGDGFGADATRVESCEAPGPDWVTVGGDCNDAQATVNPDVLWYLDQDGDQAGDPTTAQTWCTPPSGQPWVRAINGVDCDDDDASVVAASVWYADADQDGVGTANTSIEACLQPTIDGVVYVASSNDCLDTDATVYPGREEVCNGRDDDCDGLVDDQDVVANATGPVGYADADGDGYGDVTAARAFCFAVQPGYVASAGDCDDTLAAVNPGAQEICENGLDDDCDGSEQVPSWYEDADGDGVGTGAVVSEDCAPPAPTGYASTTGDCDDGEPTTYPGAAELDACDAIDSNCDGLPEPRLTWYFDADDDGFGDDATAVTLCNPPTEPPAGVSSGTWVLQGGDCDDADATVTFGRIWFLDGDGDGLGDDASTQFQCPQYDSGGTELTSFLLVDLDGDDVFDPGDTLLTVFGSDCDDANAAIGLPGTYYSDDDGDSWGRNDGQLLCPDALGNAPAGRVGRTGDCDDTEPDVFPGATETDGDGVDSDCNGFDNDDAGIVWYPDADGDGLGDQNAVGSSTYVNPSVTNNADCDDSDASISNGRLVFTDSDGDGFGAGSPSFVASCAVLPGSSLVGTDCDDSDDLIRPGGTEVCDGVDQDCDGQIDETLSIGVAFRDVDGDGYGNDADSISYCSLPAGYAVEGGDCDDTNARVSPGANEVCNDIDDNCDGLSLSPTTWFLDQDQDGVGGEISIDTCVAPGALWIVTSGDCDDLSALVGPGLPEACDGVDNDCDGLVPTGETDADGDGFFVCDGDCDDTEAHRYPGAAELCDGVADNDCDGTTADPESTDADGDGFVVCYDPDDNDTQVPSQGVLWSRDADGDGYGDPSVQVQASQPPAGFVLDATDCDDTRASVHPGAVEVCNDIDDDCDRMLVDGSPDAWFVTPGGLVDATIEYFAADLDGDSSFGLGGLFAACAGSNTGELAVGGEVFAYVRLDPVLTADSVADCEDDSGTDGTVMAYDRDGDGVVAFDERLPSLSGCAELGVPPSYVQFDPGDMLDCAPTDASRSVLSAAGDHTDADGDGLFSAWSRPGMCVAAVSPTAGSDCNDDVVSTEAALGMEPMDITSQQQLDAVLTACSVATVDLVGGPFTLAPVGPTTVGSLTLRGDACTAAPCLTFSLIVDEWVLALEDMTADGEVEVATNGQLSLSGVTSISSVFRAAGGSLSIADSVLNGPTIDISGDVSIASSDVVDGLIDGTTLGRLSTSSASFDDTSLELDASWVDSGSTIVQDLATLRTGGAVDWVGTSIDLGAELETQGATTCTGCILAGTAPATILNSATLGLIDTTLDDITIVSSGELTVEGSTWNNRGPNLLDVTGGTATVEDSTLSLTNNSETFFKVGSQAELTLTDLEIDGDGDQLLGDLNGGSLRMERVEARFLDGGIVGGVAGVEIVDSQLQVGTAGVLNVAGAVSGAQVTIDRSEITGGAPAPVPGLQVDAGLAALIVRQSRMAYPGPPLRTSGVDTLIHFQDVLFEDIELAGAGFQVALQDLLVIEDSTVLRPWGLSNSVLFAGDGELNVADSVIWIDDEDVAVSTGLQLVVLDRTTVRTPTGSAVTDGLFTLDGGDELILIDSAIEVDGGGVPQLIAKCPGGRVTAFQSWVTAAGMIDAACSVDYGQLSEQGSTGGFDGNEALLRSRNPAIFPYYGHTAN